MRKLIATMNMTLDGYCDHTAIDPDEEIHWHYEEVLRNADTALYGRRTYQLMEYWREVVENPTGNQAMDDFAQTIDNIPEKVVFSRTLKKLDWKGARLATQGVREEVLELKDQPGKSIMVGSRSLILTCLNLGLVDEFQLCVHPVIVGKGLPLFEHISDWIHLRLFNTKIFGSGAIVLYYKPSENLSEG